MTETCIVRHFVASDADAVQALILSIQRQEFGLAITLADQPDLLDIPGFYRRGSGDFWVAELAGEVVGSIALIDIGGGRGVLRKMFVAAPYRGAGRAIAQCLLDGLIARCRAAGMHQLMLGTVSRYLAAQRFYVRNGFEPIGPGSLPPDFPRMRVDDRFYRLDLTAGASEPAD